jgi:hypothetical protein
MASLGGQDDNQLVIWDVSTPLPAPFAYSRKKLFDYKLLQRLPYTIVSLTLSFSFRSNPVKPLSDTTLE